MLQAFLLIAKFFIIVHIVLRQIFLMKCIKFASVKKVTLIVIYNQANLNLAFWGYKDKRPAVKKILNAKKILYFLSTQCHSL